MVSVIIPNYNRSLLLGDAIRSVLNQSYSKFEILVCDDGSTDDSMQIVNSFNDDRIVWLPGPRMGRPAGPRNRGICAAKGDWIAFLDSDDLWHPDKIYRQLEFAEKNNLSAICTNALVLEDGELINNYFSEINNSVIEFESLLKSNKIICSSVLVSRKCLEISGSFIEKENLRALEDYELWLRISTITNWGYLKDTLITYKQDSIDSIRGKKNIDLQVQQLVVFKSFLFWAKFSKIKHSITVILKIVQIKMYLLLKFYK